MGLRLLNLKKIMSDLSANVFIVVDKEGHILDYNTKAINFLESENLFHQDILSFFNEYVSEVLREYLSDIKENQFPRCFVLDIKEKLYDCCVYPYSFGHVFSFDDITEFRDFSSYTTELTKRIKYAEKVASIGYFEIDLTQNKKFFSKELFSMFGFEKKSDENIIEQQIFSKDKAKLERNLKKIIEKGSKVETTLRFLNAKNQIMNCMFKASFFETDAEHKLVGTIQDLSNYIASKKNLKDAKKKAEAASKAKSYFIVQASHDLRQPIQAIRMFVHNFKKEKMNKRQAMMISNIDSSIEGLSYLLDNLMDISRLDYGGIKLHPYQFDLQNLIQKIEKEFEEIAHVRKIDFQIETFSLEIYSDPFFIERILRNLLSNAFKFTKNKILLKMDLAQENMISLIVEDNGKGIKKADMEYIFDEFYQSISPKGEKKDGIGLGLPIVKKMATSLSAKIFVESNKGKGSRFVVNIPIKKKA